MTDNTALVCDDLKERLVALEKLLADPWSDLYIERLLDVVVAAVTDTNLSLNGKGNDHFMSFCKRFGEVASQLQTYRRQPQDFHVIASLGRGAFGRVQLVREVTTGRVCAMKVLQKSRMLTQLTDYWTEREIMARGDSPWIVQLYYAFQDLTSLYMVMEYVPGGNLVGWMEEVEVISEAACRFYAAETVLALSDLHAMGFIHRDLKPDNLLLDAGGHVKLADFGTAIRVDPDTGLIHCDSAVGTPDYLSPEVLLSQGGDGGSYGFEVDWWALGVLVYEMLYGDTPFYSEALVQTYAKIMSHANHLKFPADVHVSDEGLDFMKQLLRDRESRLGAAPGGGYSQVTNHPWFSRDWARSQKAAGFLDPVDLSLTDWSWSNIRACRAPFQPHLTSETDTSYFQPDIEGDEQQQPQPPAVDSPVVKPNGHEPCSSDDPSVESPTSRVADTVEADAYLFRQPGVQLAFAGFSFSSAHPNHLALLNGLHLTPSRIPADDSPPPPTLPDSAAAAAAAAVNNGTSDLRNGIPECDRRPDLSPHESSSSPPPSFAVSDRPAGGPQVARLQAELEDALALAEMHSNEAMELTERLDKAVAQRREAETKLAQRETAHRTALEEAQQRLELFRSEATTGMARLEAEVSKWKALAQSEQTARQSAEAAGSMTLATATARLAKRAAEVADRAVASPGTGSRANLASAPLLLSDSASLNVNELPCSAAANNQDSAAPSPLAIDDTEQGQTVATNLLLSRVEEMAKRAHRAESAAREAADMLEAEQHFCRLYKETSAEKSDQLKELTRELEEIRELLASSQQDCHRYHEDFEAARRALTDEQQRSLRYREASRNANESAMSASRRAAMARREAAELRESLEQMKQAYETEKVKCTEAVKKLTEVMSGTNTGALDIMYMASGQPKDTVGFYLGSLTNRHKLAAIRGSRQQQQLSSQAREIKRLQTEIKRLNAELGSAKRDAQSVRATMLEMSRAACEEYPRFSSVAHSRENSDDLGANSASVLVRTSTTGLHTAPTTHQQSRTRSGFFSRGNKVVSSQSTDSSSERDSVVWRSAQTPDNHPGQLVGEPATPGWILPLVSPSPGVSHRISRPLAADPSLVGLLLMGLRQHRRKNLAWCPRVVKLTPTHLYVWDYTSEAMDVSPATAGAAAAAAAAILPGTMASAPLLELPLSAICRVRPVDPSEAIHEAPKDLAFTFQVTYDRCLLDSPVVDHTIPTSSTTATNASATLPRKFSFGSATVLSTSNTSSPLSTAYGRRLPEPSSNMKRLTLLGASGEHLTTAVPGKPANNNNSSASSSGSLHTSHLLFLRGHKLQSIRFRRMAICDLCRRSCWQFVSPPPAFQCVHCQLKFHANHLEPHSGYALPDCGNVVESHLFRCQSHLEQHQWIDHITQAVRQANAGGSRDPSDALTQLPPGCSPSSQPSAVDESDQAPRTGEAGASPTKKSSDPLTVYTTDDSSADTRPDSPSQPTVSRASTTSAATAPQPTTPQQHLNRITVTDPPAVLDGACGGRRSLSPTEVA